MNDHTRIKDFIFVRTLVPYSTNCIRNASATSITNLFWNRNEIPKWKKHITITNEIYSLHTIYLYCVEWTIVCITQEHLLFINLLKLFLTTFISQTFCYWRINMEVCLRTLFHCTIWNHKIDIFMFFICNLYFIRKKSLVPFHSVIPLSFWLYLIQIHATLVLYHWEFLFVHSIALFLLLLPTNGIAMKMNMHHLWKRNDTYDTRNKRKDIFIII